MLGPMLCWHLVYILCDFFLSLYQKPAFVHNMFSGTSLMRCSNIQWEWEWKNFDLFALLRSSDKKKTTQSRSKAIMLFWAIMRSKSGNVCVQKMVWRFDSRGTCEMNWKWHSCIWWMCKMRVYGSINMWALKHYDQGPRRSEITSEIRAVVLSLSALNFFFFFDEQNGRWRFAVAVVAGSTTFTTTTIQLCSIDRYAGSKRVSILSYRLFIVLRDVWQQCIDRNADEKEEKGPKQNKKRKKRVNHFVVSAIFGTHNFLSTVRPNKNLVRFPSAANHWNSLGIPVRHTKFAHVCIHNLHISHFFPFLLKSLSLSPPPMLFGSLQ